MFRDRKRIMVVGSGGSGKSTFSRELAQITGLQCRWPHPIEWIIDGNYSGTIR